RDDLVHDHLDYDHDDLDLDDLDLDDIHLDDIHLDDIHLDNNHLDDHHLNDHLDDHDQLDHDDLDVDLQPAADLDLVLHLDVQPGLDDHHAALQRPVRDLLQIHAEEGLDEGPPRDLRRAGRFRLGRRRPPEGRREHRCQHEREHLVLHGG